MAAARRALFVTYTMAQPGAAVGVFFRALRLSREMRRRNWACAVCNYGPIPSDPKVDEARREIELIAFEHPDGTDAFTHAVTLFRRLAPAVVLFGELPLPFIEPLFRASQALVDPPVVVLDQFYSPAAGEALAGVDYLLMYGLRSMWPGAPPPHPTFRVVPPFIDRVTPREQLPLPPSFRGRPAISVVGFDRGVLRGGIEILARLQPHGAVGITISHAPDAAAGLLAQAGLPAGRGVSLPLQSDETLFGLVAASRAVVLANGFMQIAEAIALGCPAVCVHRGIGMDSYQLDPAFRDVVAFPDGADEGARRVLAWLHESPFAEERREALARERGGASLAADFVEGVAHRPRFGARLQRRTAGWRRRLSALAGVARGKTGTNELV